MLTYVLCRTGWEAVQGIVLLLFFVVVVVVFLVRSRGVTSVMR